MYESKAWLQILMHNILIILEKTRWAWCDCDSHLMKAPGPAASIWLRLPSYNTCQVTWAPSPSLITDNKRKRERENDVQTKGEEKRDFKKEMETGWEKERSPSCSVSSTSLSVLRVQLLFLLYTKGHPGRMCTKPENSTSAHIIQMWPKLLCITDNREV